MAEDYDRPMVSRADWEAVGEENARLREALGEIASGTIKVEGRGRLGVDSFVVDLARAALRGAA